MNRLSGLFHKKIYLLWNRPEILLLTMVPDISFNSHLAPFSLNRLSGLFHKKIHSLSNRPESLFIKSLLRMVQHLSFNRIEL
jgi:hypothetical protein